MNFNVLRHPVEDCTPMQCDSAGCHTYCNLECGYVQEDSFPEIYNGFMWEIYDGVDQSQQEHTLGCLLWLTGCY